MGWLKSVKKEIEWKRYGMKRIKRVNPADVIERYGLGKRINYTACWQCKLFYKYERCPYRFWVSGQLFCVRKAIEVDGRLRKGLDFSKII